LWWSAVAQRDASLPRVSLSPLRGRCLDLEFTEAGAAGLRALEAEGFPMVQDHNRPGALGAGRLPMSSRHGVRVTTADAYMPLGARRRT
jgi:hypothetical protein